MRFIPAQSFPPLPLLLSTLFPNLEHIHSDVIGFAGNHAIYGPTSGLPRLVPDYGGTSIVNTDKDTFKVILDVQHFTPHEISVKVIDRQIVVEGKHEEKKDEHGMISRQFVRKYLLPERADVDKVSANISTDGFLTIIAPLKQVKKPDERNINIELSEKPAVHNSGKDLKPKSVESESKEEITNQVPDVLPQK